METMVPSDYLPKEIVIEILMMLPVKSLVRFTSVCKLWRSLIIDPSFIARHCNRASSCSNAYLLHVPSSFCNIPKCTLINEDSWTEHSKLEVPFETISGYYKIVGSCNGLLCLTDSDYGHRGRTLYFWNPALRNFKTCHHSCVAHRFNDLSFRVVLGFGFDCHSQDYKVIRIFYYLEERTRRFSTIPPEAEVYTLSTNTWRSIESAVPCVLGNHSGTYINGVVHWLTSNRIAQKNKLILSYDMSNDVFNEISLPDNYTRGVEVDYMFLGDFKGSISLFVNCYDVENDYCYFYHVWVMSEYGVVNSWTKKYTIIQEETIVKSFGFTKNGKLIMDTANEELEIWDPETFQSKAISGVDTSYPCSVVPFVESLVLLKVST